MERQESQTVKVDDYDDDEGEQGSDDRRSADADKAAGVRRGVYVRYLYGVVGASMGAGSPCVNFVVRLCVCTWGRMEETLKGWGDGPIMIRFVHKVGVCGKGEEEKERLVGL